MNVEQNHNPEISITEQPEHKTETELPSNSKIENSADQLKQAELLSEYTEYQHQGPRVGKGEVIDQVTGQKVSVEIHAIKEGGVERFMLVGPKGEGIGYTELRYIDPSKTSDQPDFSAKQHYGNNLKDRDPYIWVELMMNTDQYSYKKVGKLLHELAVERSLQTDAKGRVQLVAGGVDSGNGMSMIEPPATSLAFHESFGFVAKDVYNNDGSLHHDGQSIHERLANGRMNSRRTSEKFNDELGLEGDAHSSWSPLASEAKPYFYLPEEHIQREKSRVENSGSHLEANGETVDKLFNKHQQLHRKKVTTGKAMDRVKNFLLADQLNDSECRIAAQTALELFQLDETSPAKQIAQKVLDHHKENDVKKMNAFDLMEAASSAYVTGTIEQDNKYARELANREDLYSYAKGPVRFMEQLSEIGCVEAAYKVYNRYEKTSREY